MNQTPRRGGLRNPPGGRPKKPKHLQVVRCGFMTLPPWIVQWLKAQPGKPGHIVEQALINQYGLTPPKNKEQE